MKRFSLIACKHAVFVLMLLTSLSNKPQDQQQTTITKSTTITQAPGAPITTTTTTIAAPRATQTATPTSTPSAASAAPNAPSSSSPVIVTSNAPPAPIPTQASTAPSAGIAVQPVTVTSTPPPPITLPQGASGAAPTPIAAPVTAPLTTPEPPVAPLTGPLLSSGLPAVPRSPAPSGSATGIDLPSSLTPTTLSPLPTTANRSTTSQLALPEAPPTPLSTDIAGAVGVTPVVNASPSGVSPALSIAPGTIPQAITVPQTGPATTISLPVTTQTAGATSTGTVPTPTGAIAAPNTGLTSRAQTGTTAPVPTAPSTTSSAGTLRSAEPVPAKTTTTVTTTTTAPASSRTLTTAVQANTKTAESLASKPAITTPVATPASGTTKVASVPTAPAPNKAEATTTALPKSSKKRRRRGATIDFSFQNAPLTQAINRIAEAKNINIILPQGAHEIRQKITFNPGRKLTLAEAEEYLYLFLDLAGYAIRPGDDFEVVVRTEMAPKSPLNLYIFDANVLGGGHIESLPNTDETIRVVYYFANLKVEADNSSNPITNIFNEIMPSRNAVVFDPSSNGVIITEKSRLIRNVLELLKELDAAGSKHVFTTIQLYNSNATEVADLIKSQIMATGGSSNSGGYGGFGGGGSSDKIPGVGTYFSSDIKIVPDPRRNTLLIMGKEAPVNRLKDFIRESLDIPTETGKSVFHVYDLKYLDSETFAPVLASVVQGGGLSGGGDNVSAQQVGGARRSFEGVVVKAETFKQVEAIQATQTADATSSDTIATPAGTVFRGGNRLLIAATPADWEQIKRLIDQLDIPQRQVIIEVMVVDYTRGISKALKSQVRNLDRIMDFRPGFAFQAANSDNNIVVDPTTFDGLPLGIAGDLLRFLDDGNTTILSNATVGTTAISFNDPAGTGVWGLLEILNTIGKTKIITHPYVVALNNTLAQTTSTETIRAFADASSSTGGAIVTNVGNYTATISIGIVPRISSATRLNMEIAIRIEQFTDPDALSRASRTIQTNVNMNSPNQILVLGGLTRTTVAINETETPILGRIPLIGWMFRGANKTLQENELGVFIKPTIVEPRKRDAMNVFTKKKIQNATKDSGDDYLYGTGQDPIVRWFFKRGPREIDMVNDYMGDIASAAEQRTEAGSTVKKLPLQERLKQEELELEVAQTIPTEFLPSDLGQETGVSAEVVAD